MRLTVFLHSSKDSMYDAGYKLGLRGEALRLFSFTCYEVKIELEVDTETGNSKIVKVDDRELK